MQLGMIGLGRMGANMVIRLMKAGHALHVYDGHAGPVEDLATKGATGSTDLEIFVRGLTAPRAVWLMVPAAAVDPAPSSLTPLLDPGDTVIDGGNSFYQDDIRPAETLPTKGLHSTNRRRAHAARRATEPAGSKSLARRHHPRPARSGGARELRRGLVGDWSYLQSDDLRSCDHPHNSSTNALIERYRRARAG